MRLHAPLLLCAAFCSAIALFACAHAEPGKEPQNVLNSPRCVTDVECGADQKCIKDEHRPDGICAAKGSSEADIAPTRAASTPSLQKKTCARTKDCPGSPCSKKMHGKSSSCVFCDTDAHVCRTMVATQ
ncbi:MAG: hypothetical protein ACRELY_07035 [Polyangiaceae bacterium]